MVEFGDIDAPVDFEWVSLATFLVRKEQVLAEEFKRMAAEMARQSLIRKDTVLRYRDAGGRLHAGGDLPDGFLAEADIDLAGASATRPKRTVREANPYYPFVSRSNPHPSVTWPSDPRSLGEFVERVEPAVTIHAIEVLVPVKTEVPVPTPEPVIAEQKVSGKVWILDILTQEREALSALSITKASREIALRSRTAINCASPLKPRYVENVLRTQGWPPRPPLSRRRAEAVHPGTQSVRTRGTHT